jgi:hypothetical protein
MPITRLAAKFQNIILPSEGAHGHLVDKISKFLSASATTRLGSAAHYDHAQPIL